MNLLKMIIFLVLMLSILFLSACGNSDSQQVSSWKTASLLADSARFPLIGSADNGNLLAVWVQSAGFYANLYTVDSGWGSPQKIGESIAGWSDMRFAVSKSGQAIVAWLHNEPGNLYVQAVRYIPGIGWGAVENLGDIGAPKDIAIADNGNAFIVAEYTNGTTKGLTIERYSQATGWYNLQIGYTDASTSNGFPKISVNSSGNGFVLWVEGNSGTNKVYVSQFTNTVQGSPEQIASIAGVPGWTDIALDTTGNAMIIWGQQDFSLTFHTYACRYNVVNGWGIAVKIDNSYSDCIDQTLTVNSYGNFYAVWTQRTNTNLSNIYSSQYNPVSGWKTPQLAGTGGIARYPRIVADTVGNVIVTWQQYDPNDSFPGDANVYANIFSPGSGWGTQHQLKNAFGSADAPEIAIDSEGKATVLWSQSTASVGGTGTYGIFSCRFE